MQNPNKPFLCFRSQSALTTFKTLPHQQDQFPNPDQTLNQQEQRHYRRQRMDGDRSRSWPRKEVAQWVCIVVVQQRNDCVSGSRTSCGDKAAMGCSRWTLPGHREGECCNGGGVDGNSWSLGCCWPVSHGGCWAVWRES